MGNEGSMKHREEHWESVYREKRADEVSWYRPHLDRSLAFLDDCKLDASARIVDVGGGASTFVDDLLESGFTDITVLDLSSAALSRAQARLGDRAKDVRWIRGDATEALLAPDSVDLWHDRAAFHFLTDPERRAAYIERVRRAVRKGGYVIIATFALDGPEKCSGLPIRRESPESIAASFLPDFEKIAEAREEHMTPWGARQPFSYALCRRHR